MKRLTILFLFVFAAIYILPGCEGMDDNYSINPNHRLAFSVDTLSFDTVFTTVGSTTRQLMIYNRNNEALNMELIMLAGESSNGFRMNVDGRRGYEFSNVGILPNDSMYVFVEVTVDPNGDNQPLVVQDSIIFSVNGIRQTVVLEAYGQDAYIYKGGMIFDTDTRLPAGKPYLIYDSVTVAQGVTLTVDPGVTFYMHDQAKWKIEGTILANGTESEPITFRGDRLDYIINDAYAYDRAPGQWTGMFLDGDSYGNELNYVMLRNAVTGILCEQSTTDQSKLKINNSRIYNMSQDVLYAINCDIEVTNSELSNSVASLATLIGGNYRFIHSTLANYIKDVANRRDGISCVELLNNIKLDDQTLDFPLSASFDNCIIDGSRSVGKEPWEGEINIDDTGSQTLTYRFNHCVIKTIGENSGANTGNIFIDDDADYGTSYRAGGGREYKYGYDYRLNADTIPGVGDADPAITAQYPIDRYGVNRETSSNGPTIGAYEYVYVEEDDE